MECLFCAQINPAWRALLPTMLPTILALPALQHPRPGVCLGPGAGVLHTPPGAHAARDGPAPVCTHRWDWACEGGCSVGSLFQACCSSGLAVDSMGVLDSSICSRVCAC